MRPRTRGHWRAVGCWTTLASLVSLGVTAPLRAQPVAAPRDRVLVIPFENPGGEPRLYWLSEASPVLLADDLNGLGTPAITREERLEAFDRLQVPPVTALSRATVIRLGQLVGATRVVMGSLAFIDGAITVHGLAIRLDVGRIETAVNESGPLDDLFGIFERVARQLAGTPSASAVRLGPRPSLPTFENYIKGLLAGSLASRVSYLHTALELDPAYDRARLALWAAYQEDGNAQQALAAAIAVPQSSPLYDRARFAAALSLIDLKRLDDAFATLKTLADRGLEPVVLNNLGVVQLRRGAAPQNGRATQYFEQAAKLDPADQDYFFNLGYAYWTDRDLQAAVQWLREAVRRQPADGEAHAVLAAALQAVGSPTEAARERELAAQLSSSYAEWAKRPGAEAVPSGLERLKMSLERSSDQRLDDAILASGQRDQRELVAFHLDRGRRFFDQGLDTDAVAEFRRVLYLSPYQAEAHLLMGRLHLRAGRLAEAIDAFKIALWSEPSVAARVALGEAYLQDRNLEAARAEAERAIAMTPDSAEAKALLEKVRP